MNSAIKLCGLLAVFAIAVFAYPMKFDEQKPPKIGDQNAEFNVDMLLNDDPLAGEKAVPTETTQPSLSDKPDLGAAASDTQKISSTTTTTEPQVTLAVKKAMPNLRDDETTTEPPATTDPEISSTDTPVVTTTGAGTTAAPSASSFNSPNGMSVAAIVATLIIKMLATY